MKDNKLYMYHWYLLTYMNSLLHRQDNDRIKIKQLFCLVLAAIVIIVWAGSHIHLSHDNNI
jgi:peptidoglycan/LPS O-acetylase OafA/YrhL